MNDWRQNLVFTCFMATVTAFTIVLLLMYTDRVRQRDRAAFCAEPPPKPTVTKVIYAQPVLTAVPVERGDGKIHVSPEPFQNRAQ